MVLEVTMVCGVTLGGTSSLVIIVTLACKLSMCTMLHDPPSAEMMASKPRATLAALSCLRPASRPQALPRQAAAALPITDTHASRGITSDRAPGRESAVRIVRLKLYRVIRHIVSAHYQRYTMHLSRMLRMVLWLTFGGVGVGAGSISCLVQHQLAELVQ